jgi:predicted amidophosphoribosyltransferase
VWPHSGRPAELVRELKYGRATSVVTELAEAMVDQVGSVDLITWVPASPARRRRRGFDQGELLARAIGRRCRRPVRRLLARCDDVAQTSRDLEGRLQGPEFSPTGRRLRFGPAVLLVDDVVTTGSTLRAAGSVLLLRGAGSVTALVATCASPRSASAPVGRGVYDRRSTQTTGG